MTGTTGGKVFAKREPTITRIVDAPRRTGEAAC